jgi:DNA-binding transcriptional MerR regulator
MITIKALARLSGVSVRALRHYDAIGLLKPAAVGANGYRYYGREELLRLQQILFHRELDLSLAQIRAVLDAPDFDRAGALMAHRARLKAKAQRARALMRTIDETLKSLKGAGEMSEQDMFKGFDPERQERFEAELIAKGGEAMRLRIETAKTGMKGWDASDFEAMHREAIAVEAGMAQALAAGHEPAAAPVLELMARHCAWVARSWSRPVGAEAFTGLGRMYVEHPEFRARYEGRAEGLSAYMAAAMAAYAQSALRPAADL